MTTTERCPSSCARSGRLRSEGSVVKRARGSDSLPLTGEPEFKAGARHVASFHGTFTAERDDDGLTIRRGGDALKKGTPIAHFDGDRWRAEPADERGPPALHVYEIDPGHAGFVGLDRAKPRTIVGAGPRDTRDTARKTLAAINERNRAFWKEQEKK